MKTHITIPPHALKRLSVALRAIQRAFYRMTLALMKASAVAATFSARFAVAMANAVVTHRHARLILTETAGGVLVLIAVATWSIPGAIALGGLALIGAVEVRS